MLVAAGAREPVVAGAVEPNEDEVAVEEAVRLDELPAAFDSARTRRDLLVASCEVASLAAGTELRAARLVVERARGSVAVGARSAAVRERGRPARGGVFAGSRGLLAGTGCWSDELARPSGPGARERLDMERVTDCRGPEAARGRAELDDAILQEPESACATLAGSQGRGRTHRTCGLSESGGGRVRGASTARSVASRLGRCRGVQRPCGEVQTGGWRVV